ncbi:MAG: hypothetical protein ICV87_11320 [Gemmatimonadetes bacterium]|nr:hypothetical protein [Gemmatimonadota bacterium]
MHKSASILVLALAACTGDDPAKTAQRTAAHRAACVAEELAIQANSKVTSLDTLRANAPAAVVERIYPFARAYFDYARARERQTALVDSAAAAESSDDSVRFAGLAATAAPGRPSGTIQVNAAESYERDHARLLGNPDHPCNQAGEER